MAKQKPLARQQLDSLIPALKTEEKRLEDLLAEARAQADHLARDAELEAQRRIEALRAELPSFLEAERSSRRAALQQGAAQAAAQEDARARELEARARSAMEAAAQYIVSLVWGDEGRGRPGPSREARP